MSRPSSSSKRGSRCPEGDTEEVDGDQSGHEHISYTRHLPEDLIKERGERSLRITPSHTRRYQHAIHEDQTGNQGHKCGVGHPRCWDKSPVSTELLVEHKAPPNHHRGWGQGRALDPRQRISHHRPRPRHTIIEREVGHGVP
jgi:hypothetical protein